jgi:hypothetical protein
MKTMMRAVPVLVLMLVVSACWAAHDTATQTFALGVNEVAKLAVNPATVSMTINMLSTDHAGSPPSAVSSTGSFLQYTSVVPAVTTSPLVLEQRKIQAGITTGTLPDGTMLLAHVDPVIDGTGAVGVSTGVDQTLGDATTTTYTAHDLITGIKCCWTGSDTSDGAALVYTFGVSDWSKIHIQKPAKTIIITYTLTAAQ